MEEKRIDLRIPEQADPQEGARCTELCFKINHTMPLSEEYNALVKELFLGNIGEGSRVMPPITVVRGNSVKIGRGVVIMNNALMMAAGGITIDDGVMVAANAPAKRQRPHAHMHNFLPVAAHANRIHVVQPRMPAAYRANLIGGAVVHIRLNVVCQLPQWFLGGHAVFNAEVNEKSANLQTKVKELLGDCELDSAIEIARKTWLSLKEQDKLYDQEITDLKQKQNKRSELEKMLPDLNKALATLKDERIPTIMANISSENAAWNTCTFKIRINIIQCKTFIFKKRFLNQFNTQIRSIVNSCIFAFMQ